MAINVRALLWATIAGTVLQVVMVFAGHHHPSIASLFAVGGMFLSLVAGLVYAYLARGERTLGRTILGGALAGALCGFLGILVSVMLGDVPASLLLFGTLSSAVTGALGGLIWSALKGRVKAEV